jgi:uncharacterized protein (DUF305 family)
VDLLSWSRRSQIGAATVAVVLLVLLGFLAGLLTARPSWPREASADAGFARDMSEHHGQAVEIAMIAYQKATREEIRSLAGDITITQQGQIGVMQTWLKTWGLGPNSSQRPMSWMPDGGAALDGNRMPGMATREEVGKLRSATGKDVDILFCQYMHRHHLGGIHMVDGVLKASPRPEVRELAEAMKRGQSFEVDLLEKILTSLGAKPLV